MSTTTKHSPAAYIIGFILSLLLTAEAWYLVSRPTLQPATIVMLILALAVVQLLVQLGFFLHLHRATKAPWNILMFLFMALVVSTLVFGSLWIMRHLNYSHGHNIEKTNEYIRDNEDL